MANEKMSTPNMAEASAQAKLGFICNVINKARPVLQKAKPVLLTIRKWIPFRKWKAAIDTVVAFIDTVDNELGNICPTS